MKTKRMSLRQIAKELEVSPAYLSMMVNGKRPWRQDLYQRYVYFVNTTVNTQANMDRHHSVGVGGVGSGPSPQEAVAQGVQTKPPGFVVGGTGFEPMTSAMSTQRSKPLS